MEKKNLEYKIKLKIEKSSKTAFINSDFSRLSSDNDKVGRILRGFVKKKYLIKLGHGVFAKTKESKILKKRIIAKNFPDVAKEVLKKFNVKTYPSRAEKDYNSGKSTQLPTGLMIAVDKNISRKLSYNGKSIKYEKVSL